jgi:hypothetical protein
MVEGTVKTNKANGTKYIYLAKDCGFVDGQSVDIKNTGIGIYDKERLEKYVEDNKELFETIKTNMKANRKELWTDNFFTITEELTKLFDYDAFEWDDHLYFLKNNEYEATVHDEFDGGNLWDLEENPKNALTESDYAKLSKEGKQKDMRDFLVMYFIKTRAEELSNRQYENEKRMMSKLGFDNVSLADWVEDTTIYSNGLVQVWYDAESAVHNLELNVTTMREVKPYINNEEPSVKF